MEQAQREDRHLKRKYRIIALQTRPRVISTGKVWWLIRQRLESGFCRNTKRKISQCLSVVQVGPNCRASQSFSSEVTNTSYCDRKRKGKRLLTKKYVEMNIKRIMNMNGRINSCIIFTDKLQKTERIWYFLHGLLYDNKRFKTNKSLRTNTRIIHTTAVVSSF